MQDLYNVPSKSRDGQYQFKIEISFASKLLHTVNPDYPIWDSQINKKLGIRNSKKTINDAVKAYDELCTRYALMKKDQQFKTFVFNFDSLFPKFTWITETKKIDFYLWM